MNNICSEILYGQKSGYRVRSEYERSVINCSNELKEFQDGEILYGQSSVNECEICENEMGQMLLISEKQYKRAQFCIS